MALCRIFVKWSVLATILLVISSTSAQVNGKFWWLQNNIFGKEDSTFSGEETNVRPARKSHIVVYDSDYDDYESSEESKDDDSDDYRPTNNLLIPPPAITSNGAEAIPPPQQGTFNPPERRQTEAETVPNVPVGSDLFQPPQPPLDGGTDCMCVEYYLCSANNTIITNGAGIVDVRLDLGDVANSGRALGGRCPGVQVCCGLPPGADNRIPISDEPPVLITSGPPVTLPPPPPPPPGSCGVRGGDLDPNWVRILNDEDNNSTQFAEFPWMLALLRAEEKQDGTMEFNMFQCGAALIHSQVALTAAHCVNSRKEKELKIRAGEWDTQDNSEPQPHQERFIERIIMHSQFHSGALHNDIALLILDQPLDIAVNVQPVCLPPQDAVFDGIRCIATGWGVDAFGRGGKFQMILKKIELPIVPHANCQDELRKTRLGTFFNLHESFVCAGGEKGKDTCKGDGGGPLVCQAPGSTNYMQVGIVSWGIGCGDNGTPAVYANVPHFRKWIEDSLSEVGITGL